MAPTTLNGAVHAAAPDALGYRRLLPGPGEAHTVRTELGAEPRGAAEVLLTLAHISDVHVCDSQSPARAEFLDRWADPDSPVADLIEEIGTYRAQEMLTLQVAAAMVRAVNAVRVGPVRSAPVDFALLTGDNVDNAQANEVQWYLAAFEGGTAAADSGDPGRYEGVAGDDDHDPWYWHPSAPHGDRPRDLFGFPVVPGLLTAARAPLTSPGLDVPWFAVHGNHDRLLQGTVPGRPAFAARATGGEKPVALPEGHTPEEVAQLIGGVAACDPAALAALARASTRRVTPDPARRVLRRDDFVRAHFSPSARPAGHGFGTSDRAYYRADHGRVTLLTLDTVNASGGYQGSLDPEQCDWLEAELAKADAERRYVVLASHHPLDTLVNPLVVGGAPARVLRDRIASLLAAHPSVVLWLNGHTHATAVMPRGTWWEVTTPSLLDWPQQGRIVELARHADALSITTTMIDHAGDLPWHGGVDSVSALAGLSRELAANSWQGRRWRLEDHPAAGRSRERNAVLCLPDPWA